MCFKNITLRKAKQTQNGKFPKTVELWLSEASRKTWEAAVR